MLHFINGHSKESQGAQESIFKDQVYQGEFTEWAYANQMHTYLDTPYTFDDAYNLSLVKDMISEEAHAVEFHLNSFNASDVEGYEVLVLGNDRESLEFARLFLKIMKKHFPTRKNRGIKLLSLNDRGYNNLLRLKQFYKHAVITEMFFLSNPNDWIPLHESIKVMNELNKCIMEELT